MKEVRDELPPWAVGVPANIPVPWKVAEWQDREEVTAWWHGYKGMILADYLEEEDVGNVAENVIQEGTLRNGKQY